MNPEQRQMYKDKLEAVLLEIEDCLSNPDKIYNSAVFDARRKILLEYNMFKVLEVGINKVINW